MNMVYAEWKKAFYEQFGYQRQERTNAGQFSFVLAYLMSFGLVNMDERGLIVTNRLHDLLV